MIANPQQQTEIEDLLAALKKILDHLPRLENEANDIRATIDSTLRTANDVDALEKSFSDLQVRLDNLRSEVRERNFSQRPIFKTLHEDWDVHKANRQKLQEGVAEIQREFKKTSEVRYARHTGSWDERINDALSHLGKLPQKFETLQKLDQTSGVGLRPNCYHALPDDIWIEQQQKEADDLKGLLTALKKDKHEADSQERIATDTQHQVINQRESVKSLDDQKNACTLAEQVDTAIKNAQARLKQARDLRAAILLISDIQKEFIHPDLLRIDKAVQASEAQFKELTAEATWLEHELDVADDAYTFAKGSSAPNLRLNRADTAKASYDRILKKFPKLEIAKDRKKELVSDIIPKLEQRTRIERLFRVLGGVVLLLTIIALLGWLSGLWQSLLVATQPPTATPRPVTFATATYTSTPLPTATFTSTPTLTPTSTPTIQLVKTCTLSSDAWVRPKPSDQTAAQFMIPSGTQLPIIDRTDLPNGETWYRLDLTSFGIEEGWISAVWFEFGTECFP